VLSFLLNLAAPFNDRKQIKEQRPISQPTGWLRGRYSYEPYTSPLQGTNREGSVYPILELRDRLLVKDPTHRITIKTALEHAFMQDDYPHKRHELLEITELTEEVRRQFSKATASALEDLSLHGRHFSRFDSNTDINFKNIMKIVTKFHNFGSRMAASGHTEFDSSTSAQDLADTKTELSYSQFREFLREINLGSEHNEEVLSSLFDKNGNEKIDIGEFIKGLLGLLGATETVNEELFEFIDKNKDGYLSLEEFQTVFPDEDLYNRIIGPTPDTRGIDQACFNSWYVQSKDTSRVLRGMFQRMITLSEQIDADPAPVDAGTAESSHADQDTDSTSSLFSFTSLISSFLRPV